MSGSATQQQPLPSPDLPLRAAVLDALGQAVVAWDLDGRVTCANRAAAQLFGWSADAMAALRIDDLLPPLRPVRDDAPTITEIARRGESWAGDTRFVGSNGTAFFAKLVQRPLHGEAGELLGAVAVITDTSEQRQAENALRMRDQQLRTLMAHAPVIMWTVDNAGIMTYCEGAGLQQLGFSGGDFIGTSAFAHGDLAPDVAEHHRRALSGETFSVGTVVGDRNFEVHYGPLRRPRGAITGAMALAIDVTPRGETKLPGITVELGDFIDHMRHLVAIVDEQGVIVAVSRGWQQAIARRTDESLAGDGIGMPYVEAALWANLFSQETSERLRPALDRLLSGTDDLFRSEYVQPAAGEGDDERWMLLTAKRLADWGGAVIVHSDIAGGRRSADLEQQLRTAAIEGETRGRQLVSAAYELRAPIAVIRGYLSTISEYHDRLSAAELMDLVMRSQAAVAELEKLVSSLLLLSKLATSALPRSTRIVRLADVVAGAVDQLRAAHEHREFVLRSAAADARVRGDREQLGEVITQLLDNARKYAPVATPIEVDIAAPDAATVSVTVRDHGPGVPAADLGRIFSPFYRVRTADNATVAGAGIGLAVCRALVEWHGGQIEAAAAPGGGLAVTFTLPRATRRRTGS